MKAIATLDVVVIIVEVVRIKISLVSYLVKFPPPRAESSPRPRACR
jgi:hypothetical protein